MSLRNIFSRSGTDEVPVPEIEVQGDRLRVQSNEGGPEPEPGEQEDSRAQNQQPRDYRLPKTKWFQS